MESTRKEPPKVLVSKATILLGTIKKPIIIEDHKRCHDLSNPFDNEITIK
jgi:hypothetical protein